MITVLEKRIWRNGLDYGKFPSSVHSAEVVCPEETLGYFSLGILERKEVGDSKNLDVGKAQNNIFIIFLGPIIHRS